jgi:elongation factor 1-alpha
MAKEKPHINLVFIGHVDAGKSTTVGRLMFDSGTLPQQELRKLEEKAKELGKAGFEFAFVMDNLKEERERGVTIDLSHQKFISDKFEFTIIDAPGHKDFIKNMITGTSQADVACLVVAATDTEIQPQTKEHLFLCKTLGVKQLMIAVNKMDAVKFDEAKFNDLKAKLSDLLGKVGFKAENVPFLPIASLTGDNVFNKSENMSWYSGNTLKEQMEKFEEPEKPTDLPLRLPIQDVYNITGIGVVPVGRIETGIMRVNDKVIITPGREGKGVTGEIKTIEMHHEHVQEAEPGDNVGFNVRGIGKKDIARGDVLGKTDNPPTIAKEFTAQIVVLNHPTVLTAGYTPVFHIHTTQVACTITELVKQLDPATGEVKKENPDMLKNGDAAIVKIVPTKPLVIEKKEDIPHMSSFAIRDAGNTVAAGMCIDLVKKE